MIDIREKFGIVDIKKTCNESTSKIYGFIMYTRAHSYVAKVLRDEDFWGELDEISGKNWPIFAIRPLFQGHYTYPQSSGRFISFMQSIWNEPNANKEFLDFFSLDDSKDLPCFIAFKFNDDDTIEQVIYRLSNESQEEAFNSMREIISLVTKTESKILPEYKNTDAVYENVKADIESYVLRKNLMKGVEKVLTLKNTFQSLFETKN